MSLVWMVFGLVEVVGFFYVSNRLTRTWINYSPRLFEKKVFWTALIIRVVYVLFSYLFYNLMTGEPFEYGAADSKGYHEAASWIKNLLLQGQIEGYFIAMRGAYSDMGYPLSLGIQYLLTGGSILVARLVKAALSAYMCLLIYRLAKRNFGEYVGRMAAVFALVMPHFIYYCGLHLKETEMIFLSVWFLERIDFVIRTKHLSLKLLILPVFLLVSLFFFRTVLGVTAIFAVGTAVLFSEANVLNRHKRMVLLLWGASAVLVFLGGSISTEIEEVWQKSGSEEQSKNMEWRSQREGGNQFAKYAGATVFAPLIFTIPFPTMVHVDYQENQMMVNGNNYVKNILSFFVILAFYLIIKRKLWRKHTLLITYILTYLGILAFSSFAQSERFHLPVLPIALIFAAYGISEVTKQHKKLFDYWTLFMLIAIIGWSWFKLAGRGLI
ncbi:MAG: glycosyltransferase family 39 protein [Paludibacteraceae bacterium]|nr:glycosyltransferase family 39 protein [Paludibacteraceae bacterium]